MLLLKTLMVLLLNIICVLSDMKTCRIKNHTILLFILAGFTVNAAYSRLEGVSCSLSGICLPIAILFPLFGLRMLGAGDIKLFSAIGSIMGPGFVLYSMGFTFLAGGAGALGVMVLRGNSGQRLNCFFQYARSCFFAQKLLPYDVEPARNCGGRFRLAPAIAAGTLAEALICTIK